ncbi:MAG: metallophosphoesterase, partial [Thiotrichaceae bacterium]|nr:metallophosphoesterase [Thiotrichaceae bacterium]
SDEKRQLLLELINVLSKTPIAAVSKSGVKTKKKSNDRYLAVMADIHANEAALDCVLDFYKEENIQQGIVLGDIVGYGPAPRICIEKLQDSPFEVIKGNHDHAVAMANTERGFSASAKAVIDWTIEQLEEPHREWLKYLPSFSKNDNWLAVHGAPIDPTFLYGYVYLMTAEDNLNYLQEKEISLCFHGHSHMPGIAPRGKNKQDHHLTDKEVALEKYKQLLICPGSVGQPRNGNLGAQCAVYDREKELFNFINLPYSVEPVVQRMKDNNLPDQLWQRLQTGK